MKYIFVYFLPGSAGNFFGRCLNLLSNAYCFVDSNDPRKSMTTIDEKLKLLNYNAVSNKQFFERDWISFELKAQHFSYCGIHHYELPKNSYSIWLSHPEKNEYDSFPGIDDNAYRFYIDSSDCFEWGIMNALYKNSKLDVKWFMRGERLRKNSSVHKISLPNIISGEQSFFNEFSKVCDIIDHKLTQEEELAVRNLYQQWIKTILVEEDIENFKKSIGFLL